MADRAYAPEPDFHPHPLYAVESKRPLKDFDILGFSLQYELSYPTVLKMLEMGGVSVRNEDRTDEEPIIIAGGPCTFNPLPMSDFIDVFSIGDGEQLTVEICECIERTKDNTGVHFNIALNYGGRAEIVRAAKEIAKEVENKTISLEDINENLLKSKLYTAGQPDPDLVIRTSGEMRTSNFLPWQIAYSEFLFVDKNWPDFKDEDLDNAIIEYQKRTRRLGK